MHIEIAEDLQLPRSTRDKLKSILAALPAEHTRGLQRLLIVRTINNPRLKNSAALPGLYHPKQGNQSAWLEIAADVLLPRGGSRFSAKKLAARLSFVNNLAAVIFSLVGQHYFLTLKHSVKRTQIEPSVRRYTEQQMKDWQGREHKFRTRLFSPFQPTLERWAKSLSDKRRGSTAQRS